MKTTWLICANPEKYDHDAAFADYGYIDWIKMGNYQIGDIVYIFASKNKAILKYKTIVDAQDMKYDETFSDDKYWRNSVWIRNPNDKSLYSRLRLVNSFEDARLSLNALRANGLSNPPQRSKKLDGKLLQYINSIFEEYKDSELILDPVHSVFSNKRNKYANKTIKENFIASIALRNGMEIVRRGTTNDFRLMINGISFAILEIRRNGYNLRTKEDYLLDIGEQEYHDNEYKPDNKSTVSNIPFDNTRILDKLIDYIAKKSSDWNVFERDLVEAESWDLEENINKHKLVGFDKEVFVKARVNQGVFRDRLVKKYKQCCLCGINDEKILIASHIKPWSKSEPDEKIDISNGLLLCPNHDKLFDEGIISFDDDGRILISESLSENNRVLMNISENIRILMDENIRHYMKHHRTVEFIDRAKWTD